MESFKHFLDVILHLNKHLGPWTEQYGHWIYLILFLIIFCETGLVVTPFLPGDSLLFAIGALCARPDAVTEAPLSISIIIPSLIIAAILGDTVNYWIGHYIGAKVFKWESSRFFNKANLDKAHAFYEKYGGKAIILARFMPLFRTFVPFVAGVARMSYGRFMSYNVIGGIAWIVSFVVLGYYFGNLAFVKKYFSVVILAIIVLSFLPAVWEFYKHWQEKKKAKA